MNYTIRKNEGCADYEKVSLEGEIYSLNKEKLYNILKTEFTSVNNIAEGKIIIAKNKNIEMYLYDESRFIVSKLESEEYGIEVLNKMFKEEDIMIKKQFIEPKNHIIVALDTENIEEGFKVMDQCYDLVDCIKLNYPLVLKEGINIIGKLKSKYKLPIFCDFKIADVPVTNNKIIKIAKDEGGDAIMIHGIVGPDGLEEAMNAADDKIALVVQTEFTHPGGLVYTQGLANSLVELAVTYGCAAVQAPGNRPDRIREVKKIVQDKCKIVCCGVGAQGGKYDEVLKAGGDFPIIGRAIYKAEKPREYILKNILKHEEERLC